MNNYKSSLTEANAPRPTWLETKIIKKLQGVINLHCGTLEVAFPSGFTCEFGSSYPRANVRLNSLRPLLRLYFGGTNGWSESYLLGEWKSSDLTALVKWSLAYEAALVGLSKASFVTEVFDNIYHWRRDNSRKGSRKNIVAHYDLGNDFYKQWLDQSMTYSSALYQHPEESLVSAQKNKNARILELLEAKAGQNVLEIGSGWGGFAEQAGQDYDLNIHGITLSDEQLSWANKRVADSALSNQVSFSLTDYRDLDQQYDAIVSIEMFEAVGEAHWDTYFKTLKRVLKPGGNAVLQIITIEDERFHVYRKQADFIQRYVFPGGMLPSVSVLKDKISEHGFVLKKHQLFGQDYAATLKQWSKGFEASWNTLNDQGFDEHFYRLWRYYLAYCQGGFEHGTIDVGFYVLCHADNKTSQ
jgi:cyclopropane-fatty-acyl-phospholipid synthase